MFSKTKKKISVIIFWLVGLTVIASILTNTGVSAQSLPPENDTPPIQNPPASSLDPYLARQGVSVGGTQEGNLVNDQAIALGKPGTVFRYIQTYGTGGQAYLPDPTNLYLNTPMGMAFDSSGNMFVVEDTGARLFKYNSGGTVAWVTGHSGEHDWNMTGLGWPKDVAVAGDGSLWVADGNIATQINASGTPIRHFPSDPNYPPSDDYRFQNLQGVAFDTDGRMYLSDAGRERIQVFTFDGSGNPVYAATLGYKDETGTLGNHFNSPAQVVIDSNHNVYVADVQNTRVQKCVPNGTVWPWGWDCSLFNGTLNSPGNTDSQLDNAYGLAIDGTNNIYIADWANQRAKKCPADGSPCTIINTNNINPSDVAIDPTDSSKIYLSDRNNGAVYQCHSNGSNCQAYAGVPGVPYLTDNFHLNGPRGIAIDSKDALVVVEQQGQRMFKWNKDGSLAWVKGAPGLRGDPDRFYDPWAVATDRLGNIWVTSDDSHVRIYNGINGSYLSTFDQASDSHFQFKWASGITIDSAGTIYIADANRQRVMVYDKNKVFLRQIGVTDECGAGNDHLCQPMGLASDSARNLYVADFNNCRVQKYDYKGNYKMTFGTMLCGVTVDRMAGPMDVAVDKYGRVYVTEENNQRVNIYDSTGAYLTTIGNSWGYANSNFRDPSGIALDTAGNVYISDWMNHRIQKYALGVPYWSQQDLNGFGNFNNIAVPAITTYKGMLYAGTLNNVNGSQIWRKSTSSWNLVVGDGFGSNMGTVNSLLEYKGYLYASGRGLGMTPVGQLWRTMDGLTWLPVTMNGFNDPLTKGLRYLVNMGDRLCVTTESNNPTNDPAIHGGRIWCSPSGDPGTYTSIAPDGFGDPLNVNITTLRSLTNTFNQNTLFAGTTNHVTGPTLWRKVGNNDWEKVPTGFDTSQLTDVFAMEIYQGYLYLGLQMSVSGSVPAYRCQKCDGTDWSLVNIDGNNNVSLGIVNKFITVGTKLYAMVRDANDGVEVWLSKDGVTFTQIGFGGFGDINNWSLWTNDMGVTLYRNYLYFSTWNAANGGELWKYCPTSKVCK